ncbi:hypothetical protein CDO22_17920 [Sinorhizobium meliloti]|uniref:hypothetical protein n=1 Tax=Rhizobium meliloti TaxID=382 RepID=UPI000B4991C0|nr:hypothetical protein [Sinorhizobium meliloti]ASQ10197.1 hypothetical protein CDO22_08485 [Sinorhizobium meliloti]ASQ11869.1 hypothetical protein CDO22_17920 [Sinorhizobium meliloti]MQU82955.1 hypothetical protein [Sinorhizobium meliloti]MQU83337.1 hypothetical protein [Sinorhizobium meliloti]MQU83639.1 hypothetical protein [Sinorhizobium meliloti]
MNDIIEDGGPAIASGMVPHPTDPTKAVPASNLTVRDWFAGQALAGFMANTNRPTTYARDDADWAYTIADAMIAARKAGA